MERCKALLRSSGALVRLFRQAKRPFWWLGGRLFAMGAWGRKRGLGRRYWALRALQNKHAGQRCFIVCTGPSLRLADLALLQDEITFGVNSIVLALGKTSWRPTYYGIQDSHAYRRLKNDIRGAKLPTVFMAQHIAGGPLARRGLPENTVLYPLDLLGHLQPHRPYSTRFSENCALRVYDGYSVAYSMLQLAAYMGFTEIYLLGADCDFTGPSPYFDVAAYTTGAGGGVYEGMDERLRVAYETARVYTEEKGILLANATRGGKLEVLPRISLEEALGLQSAKLEISAR